jgi:hypothetical protein
MESVKTDAIEKPRGKRTRPFSLLPLPTFPPLFYFSAFDFSGPHSFPFVPLKEHF